MIARWEFVVMLLAVIAADSDAQGGGVILGQPCGGVLTAEEGAFTSGGYPTSNYANDQDCLWTIEALDSNLIEITVDHFALEHSAMCSKDYLVIEGVVSSVGSYCGNANIGTLRSTGSRVTVHFVTDSSGTDSGFAISYKQIPKPNCDGGDSFCVNGGSCYGENVCLCQPTHLGYRCAYGQYAGAGVEPPASGEYSFSSSDCSVYGLGHVTTFDGVDYQFSGTCAYVMARNADHTAEIVITAKEDCGYGSLSCAQAVTLYYGTVTIVRVEEGGVVTFGDASAGLPYSKYGFSVFETPGHIVLSGDKFGVTIEKATFAIHLSAIPSLAGSLSGLCGNMDGDKSNDFGGHQGNLQGFIEASHMPVSHRTCTAFATTPAVCNSQEAASVCNIVYTDAFAPCRANISADLYYQRCVGDVCRCDVTRQEGCHCPVVSEYARECARASFDVGAWRTTTSCGRTCPANQEFSECSCLALCGKPNSGNCGSNCLSGCQCPKGLFWDGSACVAESQCPCTHSGATYSPGETIPQGCQTCTCAGSMWSCTPSELCPATALVMGFGSVRTFDGTWFEFPGAECQYLLAEDFVTYTFTVYINMEKCGFDNKYSCVKSVKVIASEEEHSYFLVLGNDDYVSVQNDVETTLPANSGPIHAYKLSHIYTEVSIGSTGVRILWRDGTVIMKLPSTYKGNVRGLAGDFNRVTTDDMTAKNGEAASSLTFGNSWKYPVTCEDVTISPADPCSADPIRNTQAEDTCGIMKSSVFDECRRLVKYEHYFSSCKKAVCACEDGVTTCGCKALEAYAAACLSAGVVVDWAGSVCHYECPVKQTYQASTTRCGQTCRGLSGFSGYCSTGVKVQGCNCPEDMYLSSDGSCVPREQCPCYQAGGTWIANGHQVSGGVCTCTGGILTCPIAEKLLLLEPECSADEEFIDCSTLALGEPGAECAPSCGSWNYTCPATSCESGCRCKEGLVRSGDTCVRPEECQCTMSGVQYPIGAVVTDACRKMTCTANSRWVTNDARCYAECVLSGGRFYSTFDGMEFVFNGGCDYLLASDVCSYSSIEKKAAAPSYYYHVAIKSHDCPGSNQAMCLTTVEIVVGKYQFTLNGVNNTLRTVIPARASDPNLDSIEAIATVRGSYVIVDSDIGLRVTWDQATTVYVELAKDLKSRSSCGLCGNNDGDAFNDLQKNTHDVTTDPVEFGNSWKMDTTCPDVTNLTQIECGNKMFWVEQQCSILLTDFTECHAKISPDSYYERCIEESCSCDAGGDCDCFCASVANYAYACGAFGISVTWRNQDICPVMCEALNTDDDCLWKYEPCPPPCPKICCAQCLEGCYEGCYPECKDGLLYNPKTQTCVDPSKCDCDKEEEKCGDGLVEVCAWSPWINSNTPNLLEGGEFELIDKVDHYMSKCDIRRDIECRNAHQHDAPFQESVTCNTEQGYVCHINDQEPPICDDYEIRVNCCWCEDPCKNVVCPPRPTCDKHQELNITTGECCKNYSCECVRCVHNHEIKEPGDEWQENCTVFQCVPDGAGCFKVEASPAGCPPLGELECPYYAKQVTTHKPGECCPGIECVCRPEYTPILKVAPTCKYPEVLDEIVLVDGDLQCVTYNCTCPDDLTNVTCSLPEVCPAQGCAPSTTSHCGCVTSSVCECNPYTCPLPPSCGACHTLVTTPASPSTDADVCETDTCCAKYTCVPFACDESTWDIVCEDWQIKVEDNSDPCCVKYRCECDHSKCDAGSGNCSRTEKPEKIEINPCCTHNTCVCVRCIDDEDSLREIGETWPGTHDPECVTMTCMRHNMSHYCPEVEVYRDEHDSCPPHSHRECPLYEKLVEFETGPCCTDNRCECDYPSCPAPTTCPTGYILVDDDEASTRCCDIDKCCPNTCDDGGTTHQAGDVWKVGCQRRTCECSCDEGRCSIKPLPDCPTPEIPTCENSWPVVLVPNPDDHCCPHYECQCVCTVFGDPHYVTFDSTYYSYMGACHYTLVTYRDSNDLHIYSDNTICAWVGNETWTCLKTIFVEYEGTLVELGYNDTTMNFIININHKMALLPVTGKISIFYEGGRVVLEIPKLRVTVEYSMSTTSTAIIKIPYSTMFNQTVGLCGTCSNNTKDDFECNGTQIEEHNEFGECWKVDVEDEECVCDPMRDPGCNTSCDALIESGVPPEKLPSYCKGVCEDDGCEILSSEIFEQCRKIVDHHPYLDACREDAYFFGRCHVCNSSAVFAYAEHCMGVGICVDWRDEAGCPETCLRPDQTYMACAPVCEVHMTCMDYLNKPSPCNMSDTTSGCFCPDGLVWHQEKGECVEPRCCKCPPEPVCHPQEIMAIKPGTEDDCCPTKICECPDPTLITCPPPLVPALDHNHCPNYTCKCPSMDYCDPMIMNCTHLLGCKWEVTEQDACGCPTKGECKCNVDLCPAPPVCGDCEYLTEFKAPLDESSCENCCTVYQCKHVVCNDTIPPGYILVPVPGECCPPPVCPVCLLEDGSTKLPGEVWSEIIDGCNNTFRCTEERSGPDMCHVVANEYNQSTTCQDPSKISCPDDHQLVEVVVAGDTCCRHFQCVCNAPPPDPTCDHPGEILIPADSPYCYPLKKCNCSTDPYYLQTVCPGYNTALEQLTHETEIKTTWPVGVNPLDPCCPLYEVVCKVCPLPTVDCDDGYLPQSKPDPDSKCNCTVGWCQCFSCVDDDGTHHSVGDGLSKIDSEQCSFNLTCTNRRPAVDECFNWETTYSEIDHCVLEENFRNRTCTEFELSHLVDDSACCDVFGCSCDYDQCEGPAVPPTVDEFHTVVPYTEEENPNQKCCPKWHVVCLGCVVEIDGRLTLIEPGHTWGELEDYCTVLYRCTHDIGDDGCHLHERVNSTRDDCKPFGGCPNPGEIAQLRPDTNTCCDQYDCVCDPTLVPPVPRCTWPAQEEGDIYYDGCIPKRDCVCVNDTDIEHAICPNYVPSTCLPPKIYIEKDWGSTVSPYGPCCPKYECICPDCTTTTCQVGYKLVADECCGTCQCDSCATDEGLKLVGETWGGYDDDGCNVTYKCQVTSSRDLDGCYIPVESPVLCIVEEPNCEPYKKLEKIEYEASSDPDPCCTEYECVCKPCPPGWVPPPPPPPYHVAHNLTDNPCCMVYEYECTKCILEDGSALDPGSSWQTTDSDGCVSTHICSYQRIDNYRLNCFVVKTNDPRDDCTSKADYEAEHCNNPYKEAGIVDHGSGVDPDLCCEEYDCVCKPCGPSYDPHPPEVPDHHKLVFLNTTNAECCPEFAIECLKCVLPGGEGKDPGETWTTTNASGCVSTHTCLHEREGDEYSCYKVEVYNPWEHCEKIGDFEAGNCQWFQHAVVVVYGSGEDPDACCDEFECVCDECVPQPTPAPEPCHHFVVNGSDPNYCCPQKYDQCLSCHMPDGSCLSPGETVDIPNADGCLIKHLCTNLPHTDGCYKPKVVLDPTALCYTADQYARVHCNSTYEKAVEIVYGSGDADPDVCCPEYECVCEDDAVLIGVCPQWTDYKCDDNRLIRVDITPPDSCCPQYDCQCPTCPPVDTTCLSSWSPVIRDDPSYPAECGCKTSDCVCNKTLCPSAFPQKPNCNETYLVENEVNPTYYEECCPLMNCTCVKERCYLEEGPKECQITEDRVDVTPPGSMCCPRIYRCICKTEEELDVICPTAHNFTVPPGYEIVKVENMPSDTFTCCGNYTPVCTHCVLENGELHKPGERWYETDENGCNVTKLCTDQLKDDTCHRVDVTYHEQDGCVTKDDYERLHCTKENQIAKETRREGVCCSDFECECESYPQKPEPLCSLPGQILTDWKRYECYEEKVCVCANDSAIYEADCPNYHITSSSCRPNQHVEVVGESHAHFGPCCPVYECVCNECPANDTVVCPEGWKELVTNDLCCDIHNCECESCYDTDGVRHDLNTQWVETNATGCEIRYTCRSTAHKDDIGCYIPSVELVPCPPDLKCEEHSVPVDVVHSPEHPDPNSCCVEKQCECNKCVLDDGTLMDPGTVVTSKPVPDGCSVTINCTRERDESHPHKCYAYESYSHERYCVKKDDYENNKCHSLYQKAQEVVYGSGEVDMDLCCTEYECVCKDNSELSYVCPSSPVNDYICAEPGRQPATYPVVPGTEGCCSQLSCDCYDQSDVDPLCPGSNPVCDAGEVVHREFTLNVCCPTYTCVCDTCPPTYKPYPPGTPGPYEEYANKTLAENPLQKCCPELKIVCREGNQGCPIVSCPPHHHPHLVAGQTDPATNGCCPLYECVCDEVCLLANGTAVPVGHTWRVDVGDGCMVSWNCTDRLSSVPPTEEKFRAAAPVPSCYIPEVIKDPRLACKSEIQFEEMYCTDYQQAIEYEYREDVDPCCTDFKCVCKDDSALELLCPNFNGLDCLENMHSEEIRKIANTSECCPEHNCVCDDDEILAENCPQWHDYTCPPAMQRYVIEEPNNETRPCCPQYGCRCLPNNELAVVCDQWNVTCPLGDRRERINSDEECCPQYECVCEKCVFNGQTYNLDTSFTNSEDHCEVGTCVLNPTTGCPEVVLEQKYECPPFDEVACDRTGGTVAGNETSKGCCKYCIPNQPCVMHTEEVYLNTTIDSHRCWSNTVQTVKYCEGSCPTTHAINSETGLLEGECQCCLPASTVNRNYVLICDDALPRSYSHGEILACGCTTTSCESNEASLTIE